MHSSSAGLLIFSKRTVSSSFCRVDRKWQRVVVRGGGGGEGGGGGWRKFGRKNRVPGKITLSWACLKLVLTLGSSVANGLIRSLISHFSRKERDTNGGMEREVGMPCILPQRKLQRGSSQVPCVFQVIQALAFPTYCAYKL